MTKGVARAASAGLLVLSLALAGCVGYSNYPNIPSARAAANNPNVPANVDVTVAALRYVLNNDGALDERGGGDGVAINLPPGTRRSNYQRIAALIGPKSLVFPYAPGLDKPVYHIARLWVRGSHATVDVVRPKAMGGGAVTLWLEGGLTPWRVVRTRSWAEGIVATPELYPLPENDRVDVRTGKPLPEAAPVSDDEGPPYAPPPVRDKTPAPEAADDKTDDKAEDKAEDRGAEEKSGAEKTPADETPAPTRPLME